MPCDDDEDCYAETPPKHSMAPTIPQAQSWPRILHSSMDVACKGKIVPEHGSRYVTLLCDECGATVAVLIEPKFLPVLISLLAGKGPAGSV
jgi:hypothetical protein